MRDLDTLMKEAIEEHVITTALAVKLEFKTETVNVWTGIHPVLVTGGTGDPDLDGVTFQSLSSGVVGEIGENTYSYSGSSELTVTLAVPSDPDISIAAASIYPSEYLARPAILWRAILIRSPDPLGEPVWVWQRIRTGKMDKIEVVNSGSQHTFQLTIEAAQANMSNASNQTYLNQRNYDPNDSSQDFAPSIANGKAVPSSTNFASIGGLGGGFGGFGENYSSMTNKANLS